MIFDRHNDTCRAARDAVVDGIGLEAARKHRSSCAHCQRYQRELENIQGALDAIDRPLDELTRARIEARLGPFLDVFASANRRPAPSIPERLGSMLRRPGWVIAAAAVALVLAVLHRPSEPPPLEAAPSFHLTVATGAAVDGTDPLWSASHDHVLLAAGGVVDGEVGNATIRLHGPAEIESLAAPAGLTRIRLLKGLLFVDVEHHQGRAFEIETAGAVVSVIGTRFLVDATTPLIVATERGCVEVRGPAFGRVSVSAGEVWSEATGLGAAATEPVAALGRWRKFRVDESSGIPAIPARPTTSATTSAPPTVLSPPRPETAEQLYRQAERAMKAGEDVLAGERLQRVVRRYPADPLAGSALFDLGRLAARRGDRDQARAYLEELLSRQGDLALAESANHLLCRLETEGPDRGRAFECLIQFRRRFPSSPHDRAVLRALIGVAEARGGCAAMRPWLEEWTRSYPDDAFTAAVTERLQRCAE